MVSASASVAGGQGAALRRRLCAAVVFVACTGLLAFAATLTPNPAGHGTHEQLGLSPCSMMMYSGYPCPTCGGTTAFAHFARGEVWRAFVVQPAAAVAAALVFATAIGAGYVVVSGASVAPALRRVGRRWVLAGAVVLVLGAWAYKVAQVRGAL